ncbi:MAG: glycosyltransferase [Rhodospirillaceae bacterium]
MDVLFDATVASLAMWLGLVLFWGRFWWADQHLPGDAPNDLPRGWPAVVAVIPARNEAPTIGRTVRSLLTQDYPGDLSVIVVDDNSDDGTEDAARDAAARIGQEDRLTVIDGNPLKGGWSGKLWAVHQGIAAAAEARPDAPYILMTDADIAHDPGNLRRLAAKAEMEGRDLVSLMVRLNCETGWERLLIPAFVFFFQKLYPFPWVNDPVKRMAAAAGGCMLVRRKAVEDAGGIAIIRDRIIDDCALAALLKASGTIWLGLGDRTVSLRRYDDLAEIWRMVARTAFAQLRRSPVLLAGSVIGMAVLYLTPPLALAVGAGTGDWGLMGFGAGAWALMTLAYFPTLRRYGFGVLWGLTLPVAGGLYTLMTVGSAIDHWRGRGGAWKGRTYAGLTATRPPSGETPPGPPDPRKTADFVDW